MQGKRRRAAVATTEEQGWPGTIGVLGWECLALIIRSSIADYKVTQPSTTQCHQSSPPMSNQRCFHYKNIISNSGFAKISIQPQSQKFQQHQDQAAQARLKKILSIYSIFLKVFSMFSMFLGQKRSGMSTRYAQPRPCLNRPKFESGKSKEI